MTKIVGLYELRVKLVEDLHTGTGTGLRGIDSAQALDRHGHPVIRSTHLRGVLRAAADELVALEAAKAAPKYTGDDVERLFGPKKGNQPGRLVLHSLYLAGSGDRDIDRRLVWVSTARNEYDRSPKPDTLRSVEYAPAGTEFKALLMLRNTSPELESLLKACIKRTDRLGSSRTRGDGLVHMDMVPLPGLAGHESCLTPREPGELGLRLFLRNLDPLCLPITGNPGNIIPSECFIRGQRLLGSLAAWEMEHGTGSSMLFERHVRVGHALPLPDTIKIISKDDRVSAWDVCPIPLGIHSRKPTVRSQGGDPGEQPWWKKVDPKQNLLDPSKTKNRLVVEDEADGDKLKRPKDTEFLFRKGPDRPWTRYCPEMGVHLRNRVPDDRGTSTDKGSLYSQEEIAENTLFLSDIFFDDDDIAEKFSRVFDDVLEGKTWLMMGRGGRPLVVAGPPCWFKAGEKAHASGDTAEQSQTKEGRSFTLTLESDLIARSPNLGFYDTLDEEVLKQLAGVGDLGNVKMVKSFAESTEIRGFNAASGLPKAPLLAIRRGSAIRIAGDDAPKLKEQLAKVGCLGERTWEGFGRFRLDFDPMESSDSRCERLNGEGTGDRERYDKLSVRETVIQESRILASEILKKKSSDIPSKNQWHYLRQQALVASSRSEGGYDLLSKCFNDLEAHAKTKGGEKWKAADLAKIQTHSEKYYSGYGLYCSVLFVDSLVRWILVELKKKEAKN